MANQNVLNAPIPFSSTKGGTGQSSYTQGDLLYASATDTLSKLAGGTTGQVLGVTGVAPVTLGWVSNSAFAMANIFSSGDDSYIAGATVPVSTGSFNVVFCARDALPALTSGGFNTLFGDAGNALTSGFANTIVGHSGGAGRLLSTGGNNTFMGYQAGQNVSTDSTNTYFGASAGLNVATGGDNVGVGYNAGQSQASLSSSVIIGTGADVSVNALTNVIVIGKDASCSTSNTAIVGNTSLVGLGIGTTTAGYSLTIGGAGSGSVFMPRSSSQTIVTNGGVYAVSSTDLPYYVNQNATFALASAVTTNYGTANTLLLGNGTNYTPLVKGSNATVLTVNGSGNVVWAAPAAPFPVYYKADGVQEAFLLGNNTFSSGLGGPIIAINSLQNPTLPSVTTSADSILIGALAPNATSYSRNIAIGYNAGDGLVDGALNTLIGFRAGNSLVHGNGNVIIGDSASTAQDGSGCVIIGRNTASNGGTEGVIIGKDANSTLTGQSGFVTIGIASQANTDGVAIGNTAVAANSAIAIGPNTTALINTAVIGGSSLTGMGIGTNTATYSITVGTAGSKSLFLPRSSSQTIAINGGLYAVSSTDLPYYTNQNGTFDLVSATTTNFGVANTLLLGNGTNYTPLVKGSNGTVLTVNGSGNVVWAAPATSGTVTSVATSTTTGILLTGSPITSSGTLGINLPGSGGASAVVAGDLLLGTTGAYAGLAIGGADTYLHSNGTTAAWVTPPFAPIVTGGAADTAGQATIAASTTSITVNTTAIHTGSIVVVSIGGYTGTASLVLGPVAVTTIADGTSFDISIATVVPSASTVLVNWMIVKS